MRRKFSGLRISPGQDLKIDYNFVRWISGSRAYHHRTPGVTPGARGGSEDCRTLAGEGIANSTKGRFSDAG